MLVPVGEARHQELVLVQRNGDEVERQVLEAVRFVPLLSGKS